MSSKYEIDYTQQSNSMLPPNKRIPKWKSWVAALMAPLQWLHDIWFGPYDQGATYNFYSTGTVYKPGDRTIDIDNAVYEAEYSTMVDIAPGLNQDVSKAGGVYAIVTGTIGTGYTTATVTITGDGTGATATPNFIGTSIIGYTITNQGKGYTFANVVITGDGTGATGTAYVLGYWQKICDTFIGVQERIKYRGQKLSLEFALNRWFRTTFRQPPLVPDIYIVNNQFAQYFYIGGGDDSSSNFYGGNNPGDGYIINDNSTSQTTFSIFVPNTGASPRPGFYDSLQPFADEKIREIADQYVVAGILYDIKTY